MSLGRAYLDDVLFTFRKQKSAADKALAQIDDATFYRTPGEHSNSIAAIVKHVGGNLTSRFTDFLTADGEKPWRDRDAEFVIRPDDSRAKLLEGWERGWNALISSLQELRDDDLARTVRIRGEAHTVLQAINRSLAHTSYHVGQIVYLARLMTNADWTWITIPPGGSRTHKKPYLM
jgi:uncharacterized damage-inducible protein DinB